MSMLYLNVKKISRTDYAAMLNTGIKFRDWALYEPQNNPKRIYYIVDLGGMTLNKVVEIHRK